MVAAKTKSLPVAVTVFTITPGKAYAKYNMEQQAQMVQERYLLRNNSFNWLPCNQTTTLQQLENVIPF